MDPTGLMVNRNSFWWVLDCPGCWRWPAEDGFSQLAITSLVALGEEGDLGDASDFSVDNETESDLGEFSETPMHLAW